ncbi:uncharacterized protein DSM5745_00134 [Aspergillus mulundensis]|uniref:Hydrophobin n=1 Tax=Aspergillus mulundensis TaxID=1810919 RepID=A0A3D8T2M6_9EURO|nr:hypothetical protein DSM5745_00134 [Aspergillus mulundensis]RDW92812.1 hypothetical protein DSM5745_00134 [Aspergillus mulundensis]
MQFLALLAIAATATASALRASSSNIKLATSEVFRAQGEGSSCGVGSYSCCSSAQETSEDNFLSFFFKKRFLSELNGNEDCLVDHTESGPVCKSIIACCSDEWKLYCVAINDSANDSGPGGKGSGGSEEY